MIDNVSDTAFWIAEHRANETDRPDALFRDPLARRLSGQHGRDIANSMPAPRVIAWSVVMRTLIIDGFIRTAVAEGADVIVNLGAGLDTRPYRMELPETLRWIEVDFPGVIDFKESTLADQTPKCHLQRIGLDLADRDKRRAFLKTTNDSAKKILVLTEGVIPYLSVTDVGALGDDLRATEKIAYWIVDYFTPRLMQWRNRAGMRDRMRNAPFLFNPADWFQFFESHGWKQREMKYLADEAKRVGRSLPVPWYMRLLISLRTLFIPAKSRARLMQFAGYAVLQPIR